MGYGKGEKRETDREKRRKYGCKLNMLSDYKL